MSQNKKQKELIRSIQRSFEKTRVAYNAVVDARLMSKTESQLKDEQYLMNLKIFMNSCDRMILDIQIQFGETSDDIGFQQACNEGLKPYTLN
jgi:hypothetical protein